MANVIWFLQDVRMLWCLAEEIRKSSSLISIVLKCLFKSIICQCSCRTAQGVAELSQSAAVWDAQAFLHKILVNSSTESQGSVGVFFCSWVLSSAEEEWRGRGFSSKGLSCLCWIPELERQSSLGSRNGLWNIFNVLFLSLFMFLTAETDCPSSEYLWKAGTRF